MTDDQVKYSDLIAQDVQPGLTMLAEALKAVAEQIASLKTEATALKGAMSAAGTATREQQQATAQQAASVEGLSKKVKQLTEEERRLEEVRKRYKKLTDEQIERVNAFQQALRGSTQQQMAAVNAIEVETKSYNELNAMYNALKDSLNAMTVAERQNTEAGKAMTVQSAKIYDTMNELQKATGKYTLQVGKYRAAFDGLGYSFQQILREAPSALNLNQFFLAISNNIPMFTDQLKAFRDEQKEIRVNLETMTKGTREYAEQQEKVVSLGQKLGKVIFSWQSLVLLGLLALRNLPKIVDWFKELFGNVKNLVSETMKLRWAMADLWTNVEQKVSNTATELTLLVDRLGDVKRGTKEWENIINRINEITNGTLNATTAQIDEVKRLTKAYMDQQIQLATNAEVVSRIGTNRANIRRRNTALSTGLPISERVKSITSDADQQEKLTEILEEHQKAVQAYNEALKNGIKDTRRVLREEVVGTGKNARWAKNWHVEEYMRPATESELRSLDQERMHWKTSAETYIDDILGIVGQDIIDAWEAEYKAVQTEDKKKNTKDPKEPKDQVADLETLKRAWEDAVTENIENEYKQMEEAERLRHERFVKDKEAELALVKNDPERTAMIKKQIEEDGRTHERKMEEIDEKRYQNLQALTQKRLADEKKAAEEEEKQEKENAKGKLKAAVDGWAQYKAKMVEEGKTRKQIVEAEVAAEIARLNLMLKLNRDINGEKMSDEQRQKVEEWINLLERLQQTGNYGDYKPGQFMGKGGANVTNERKNYANIWEVLGIDMDNNQVSALNSVFDQAKEALNSWMDARKAAADQAKELADDEVSAAENALNREIELRNQGYANDVALREKELADAKEQQKKALEMQQKAKEEELAINTALEASNMAVAIANLIKQFGWWSIPMIGVMLGAWTAAKVSAFSQIKSTKYREGGVMLLEGGSHESGHDVNLGIGPDGSNLRAEGGEYFAVINKRSSRKYGSQIPAVVNALNSGMFEDRYIKTSDAVGLLPQVIRADNGTAVDLSSLEGGVDALVKQGESRWSTEGEWKVMRYKNLTRRVRVN